MLTKAQCMNAAHGTTFHHVKNRGSDGHAMRVRVTGRCQVWKTKPDHFRLPVKHGMYSSGAITQWNATEWCAECPCDKCAAERTMIREMDEGAATILGVRVPL